ncbi:MAG: DNRLRE domain-containing protein [Paludibacter sp.]|nr:DNRLRE domain-containing protein [Paludibacter sp.]
MKTNKIIILLLAMVAVIPLQSRAQSSAVLHPCRDNTIYNNDGQARTDSLSNGTGEYFVTGNVNTAYYIRRALIKFDFCDVPSSAIVDSVVLAIKAKQNAQNDTGDREFSLYRLTSTWGEGTSNAGSTPGTGTYATTGDATWKWNFYTSSQWTTPGGDYYGTASGNTGILTGNLVNVNVYWRSSMAGNSPMVSDVQNWINGVNYGWIIIGVEDGTLKTATMFYSRESSYPPTLTVYYHMP